MNNEPNAYNADAGEIATKHRKLAKYYRWLQHEGYQFNTVYKDGTNSNPNVQAAKESAEAHEEAASLIERQEEHLKAAAEYWRTSQAEIERLRDALECAIAANELVLSQLKGGSDLTADQVVTSLNESLDKARDALKP